MARLFSLWMALAAMVPLTSAAESGFYIGAGAGGARLESDWYNGDGSDNLPVGPQTPSPGAADAPIAGNSTGGTDIAFQAFAGYRIFDFLAVEAGYVYLGEIKDSNCFTYTDAEAAGLADVNSGDCKDQEWSTTAETDGWQLSVMGILPINDTWEVFLRAGWLWWDTDTTGMDNVSNSLFNTPSRCPDPPGSSDPACVTSFSLPQAGAPPVTVNRGPDNRSGSEDGGDFGAGIGATVKATDQFSIRGEFEWFDIDYTDTAWFLSLSAVYAF
jgi:opacity protein-like surface antigen